MSEEMRPDAASVLCTIHATISQALDGALEPSHLWRRQAFGPIKGMGSAEGQRVEGCSPRQDAAYQSEVLWIG